VFTGVRRTTQSSERKPSCMAGLRASPGEHDASSLTIFRVTGVCAEEPAPAATDVLKLY
jgi:hypothetical protein